MPHQPKDRIDFVTTTSTALGETIKVTHGSVERTYRVIYQEDPPDRAEAIQFLNANGGGPFPNLELPAEIHQLPIDQANEYLRQHPIRRKWDALFFTPTNSIEDRDLERLRHLPELVHLKIFSNRISDQGVKHLSHLQNLESLVLYSDQVTPASLEVLRELPKLRRLDMQSCPKISKRSFLTAVATFKSDPEVWPPHEPPDETKPSKKCVPGKLHQNTLTPAGLRFVDFHWKQLDQPPPDLCAKDDIWRIDLIRTGISRLPDKIGNLQQLRTLYANWCKLSSLPDALGKLRELQHLWLNNNQIRELPSSMENLENLLEICLDENAFNRFPEVLLKLRALENLRLVGNAIPDIPGEIQDLQELRNLSLGNNQIHRLPDAICHLPHLNYLGLQGNPIKKLPEGIWHMPCLITLNIRGTDITKLPPEARQIPNLLTDRRSTASNLLADLD